MILILAFFSRFKVLPHRYVCSSSSQVDMGRNSRSRSTRRAHRKSGRRRSPRRSPRERSPRRSPREDSRHRSDHKRSQTDRFDPPSSWNSSDTHWDTKTEYGLNFPHLTVSHIGFVLSFYLCMRQSRIFHCWVKSVAIYR